MENRIFFPQAAFDQWIIDESVEVRGTELTIVSEARRYVISEAVRVVAEVSGTPDKHELVGKVKARQALEELGAEILEDSMIIGENAYQVVQGWLGKPVGAFDEHLNSPERVKAKAKRLDTAFSEEEPTTDEDLLTRFVNRTR
jgi:hypothetical protein